MRAEQEAVVEVEALGVGGALSPGLGMAGPEQRRQGDPGDGAGPLPVIQEASTED